MRKMTMIIFVLIATLLGVSIAAADTNKKNDVNTKHANITCENCHGTSKPTVSPNTLTTCVVCHGNYDKLAQATDSVIPNPHRTHFTDMPCGECHKIHSESSLQACTICHNIDMKVP